MISWDNVWRLALMKQTHYVSGLLKVKTGERLDMKQREKSKTSLGANMSNFWQPIHRIVGGVIDISLIFSLRISDMHSFNFDIIVFHTPSIWRLPLHHVDDLVSHIPQPARI